MIDTPGATEGPCPAAGHAPTSPHPCDAGTHAAKSCGIQVFYINRDLDSGRRMKIEPQLEAARVPFERISGINGLAVPEGLRHYFFAGEELKTPLNPGEVGCYASHLKVLQTIVARDIACALVLEDDALIPADLGPALEEVVSHLPASWDVVHVCGVPRRAVKPIVTLEGGRTLVRYSRIPSGAYGYLVSRTGARKLLKPMKRYWPFDTDLRRPWLFNLKVYGVDPELISHNENSASVILAIGGRSRARRGLPIPSRGAWTGNPLHCPEGVLFNVMALGPVWWIRCWGKNVASRSSEMWRLWAYRRRQRRAHVPNNKLDLPIN